MPEKEIEIEIEIDGQIYAVAAEDNLLHALLKLQMDLPYFCWHPEMGSVGACRQCAVIQYANPDDELGRIAMACMTPVVAGARFSLKNDKAQKFRQSVIENLMLNHPHDCPVCEEGGECHLQDMTVLTGHRDRKYRGLKTTHRNQYLGPLINHEMNRCITCYRCTRYYRDYAGGTDLAAFSSRDRVFFGREEDGVLENGFSGNLVEVCPTGVFTDKTLSEHYTRKWDLRSAPTVCVACSLGCNTLTSERYGALRRVHNRYHEEINGYFLCDRGRFGAAYVNHQERIPQAGQRNSLGTYDVLPSATAVRQIGDLINSSKVVVGIGSPRASVESNFALQQLVGSDNFYRGESAQDAALSNLVLEILSNTNARKPSLSQTENYDAVIILGEDTTNHAPRLALSIRQAVRNKSKSLASDAGIPVWHDAAVRNLAQSDRHPLFLATVYQDSLEDISQSSIQLKPQAIAALGYKLAQLINEDYPGSGDDALLTGSGLAIDIDEIDIDEIDIDEIDIDEINIDEIASALKTACKPLVISGTSLKNPEILKAAGNLANALAANNPGTGLFLTLNEANSMGLAMMGGPLHLDSLPDQIDIALALENDLSLRMSSKRFSSLLERVGHLIVLDSLDNPTVSASRYILPAATFAESEGTFINNEGRAQRSFAVFNPQGDIKPAWQWINEIHQASSGQSAPVYRHVDEVIQACASSIVVLRAIVDAAPSADFRVSGQKVARMTPRSSGRTAMTANLSVHEPLQPVDQDSALSYSMEGIQVNESAQLMPYIWSPGWNSNQAINKFSSESSASPNKLTVGVKLIVENQPVEKRPVGKQCGENQSVTSPQSSANLEAMELIPHYHLFGSEELSARTAAINELAPGNYLGMNSSLATSLEVTTGDGVEYLLDGNTFSVEVRVDDTIPDRCLLYPVIQDAVRQLIGVNSIDIRKSDTWTGEAARSNQTITTDRVD